ncbi:threonyl-tRNA synthetase [Phaeobacter gallaeciensis]|uniref:Threonine--tRNA ligase n=1 Tax=Phaeobacter gallaeciensis TaxID=60890 RepID=A0A1B0ZN69_9RHOB|nr:MULTISPECIES: threonine--tRNA ligase [Phaeobacter]ANP35609.1 threonyl-tRNA synthetase [Phaeobacter gallaeciensis]MDE4061283.1 threonine--tRNA ligase [Phaeobacter gallaeciensis]MDE4124302.1 threonine--tRNA ligase [Phaeobacter gallaeciensis]MDE4128842.1 threonine--tRNA ligase [Phaeobacter gallaeciensis]PVZ45333.1 threonine--tRNA ligase [Phaeobacter sp. JL2872]
MAQISLTLPDGNARSYDAGVTPAEVAADISTSLAKKAISATVDGKHWDLQWPINADASIALHTMKDEDQANELIRHDLAHIMARAVQEIWPETKVTIGPVIENGWYYDFDRAEPFTPEDLGAIEKKMKEIINKREPVTTEVWDRERAVKFYEANNEPYKVELIDAIPGDEPLRMYWHGHWQDLCRGPHLQHTGQVPGDAFKLMSIAGAYWRGDSDRAMLQRIYGVAFTGKEKLKAYLTMLEEAAKRDHRKLGREMDLFHMQEEAPGQVFWHPNGWKVYTTLQDYMRRQQERGGYVEVNTPQVVDRKLWEASGHWDKYQENMFIVEVDEDHAREKAVNALKPMNCPCHVQVFNQGLKSYRDLPLRMAEFGSCARYEPSGALHGIMRVRGFTQDDGHIFCTEDQIESETARFIDFLSKIYADLGFHDWTIKLSTRPEKRIGSDESWDFVEKALGDACKAAGYDFEILEGEGAFYGPKLEFTLTDAIGRNWQCGTLQVDPNLPERLEATYVGQDGAKHRPFMLHRATLGSFERFIGILIEEHAGKLPFWLAPRQVVVASITSEADDYVAEVVETLKAAGVRAEADIRNEKINYKVREHSLGKVPVILAVGHREVEERTVSVRRLGEKQTKVETLADVTKSLGLEATPPDLL